MDKSLSLDEILALTGEIARNELAPRADEVEKIWVESEPGKGSTFYFTIAK